MGDNELVCNFRKCRKKLTTFAWVTACSHIFCDEDGTREFARSFTCPACETNLSAKCDLIRMDLHPSEQYKSMVLAGQKPETVLEICTRAVSFWMYQTQQEKAYQEFVATKAKERNIQLEQYYEQILTRSKTELTTLRSKVTSLKKELDTLKKKHHELSEQFCDKGRQYQKLQSNYDQLRRKHINPKLLESEYDLPGPRRQTTLPGFGLPLGGDADHELLRRAEQLERSLDRPSSRASLSSSRSSCKHSPAERDHSPPFVFKPQHTPVISTDSAISLLQTRFNMDLDNTRSPCLSSRSGHKSRT